MDGYSLSEAWFDFVSKNADKVECKHSALFYYIVEVFNKRKWPDVVGLPTDFTMGILNIGSYKTYKKTFDDLVAFGFIEVVEQSKNQFTSTKIALVKNAKADTKADSKHLPKQDQSSCSIIKQVNIETIKLLDKETFVSFLSDGKLTVEDLKNLKSEIESCLPPTDKKDKSRKKKEPSESELSVHALTKAVFMNDYKNRKGSEYIWSKKDGAMLKDLISKLTSKLRTKEPDFDPEAKKERIPNGLKFLLTGVKKGSWYDEHFEIAILNSKFNEIYAIALKEKEEVVKAAKPQRTISDAIIEARGF